MIKATHRKWDYERNKDVWQQCFRPLFRKEEKPCSERTNTPIETDWVTSRPVFFVAKCYKISSAGDLLMLNYSKYFLRMKW